MIFHENGLLTDDSHEISCLILCKKLGKMLEKFVFCCRCDWSLKGYGRLGFWNDEFAQNIGPYSVSIEILDYCLLQFSCSVSKFI